MSNLYLWELLSNFSKFMGIRDPFSHLKGNLIFKGREKSDLFPRIFQLWTKVSVTPRFLSIPFSKSKVSLE